MGVAVRFAWTLSAPKLTDLYREARMSTCGKSVKDFLVGILLHQHLSPPARGADSPSFPLGLFLSCRDGVAVQIRQHWTRQRVARGQHPSSPARGAYSPSPGGNPGANIKSISHRCYLRKEALKWELTKDIIYLPLGCLQGGVSPHRMLEDLDDAL